MKKILIPIDESFISAEGFVNAYTSYNTQSPLHKSIVNVAITDSYFKNFAGYTREELIKAMIKAGFNIIAHIDGRSGSSPNNLSTKDIIATFKEGPNWKGRNNTKILNIISHQRYKF